MKVNITAAAAALSMELDEDMEVGTVALLAAAEIGEESTQVSVLECTSVSCECRLWVHGRCGGERGRAYTYACVCS
jgi:hypothetical protein